GAGPAGGTGGSEDAIKNLQLFYKGLLKVWNEYRGYFKKIIAGPFGEEFLDYLRQQGEKGAKLLAEGGKKLRKAYQNFIKEQLLMARESSLLLPKTLFGQLQENRAEFNFRQGLIGQGITNEDVQKYEPMVEKYIRDYVVKNWNEASTIKNKGEVALGNTGMCVNDIRQHLRTEVCVALYNYNPDYRTKEGKSVKESTFVYQHLFNRIGQLMKRLTKKRYGYGVWHSNLEETMWEIESGD
ncbi:MAG: hypothetical protein EB127_30075, partial [Alphaproteobacteria bacterium]|nr:hypothetical protein [Alphaproteobacteria bacterium]